MDSRDEELTLKNVDEQVEQYLSRPQASLPPTMTSLPRVARNLQSIYEEEHRLEHIWARINSKVASLNADNAPIEDQPTMQQAQIEKNYVHNADKQTFKPMLRSSNRHSWNTVHGKKWYNLGIGLVAAIILIAFLTWPILSYVFHNTKTAGSPPIVSTATPQIQSTAELLNTKPYVGQYFKIEYPANWVITSTTTRDTGSYLQTAQFRPSATSSVFVNVNAMSHNNYSAHQLLDMDPDVKLGTLLNTNTITYNGLSWIVGVVELAGSKQAQAGKLEVAYANQSTSYRIEFGAASNMFSSHTQIFNAIFASFYAQKTEQKTEQKVGPTVTPIVAPSATPTATPSPIPTPLPTMANVSSIRVYSCQYFTIQYPANWVITSVTTGGIYQQTVQFRPSATSAIFVNVNVMYSSDLASSLLLLIDPDVKLGALLSTNTVTYNGLPWTVGIVNLLGGVQTQSSKIEVAYANQNVPYKIEFSAPSDMFSSYTDTFNAMFASFHTVG